jgi:CRP/FNR family transcriptional regulator, cyclic AMP receptor protein
MEATPEMAPDSAPRVRPLADQPLLAARAAELLRTPSTQLPLSTEEAAIVVAHMRLVDFPPGSTVLREGEAARSEYMLLLLEGQVQVDTQGAGQASSVTISVLGPGAIVGEMSLLDGAPRSATCTAMGPVRAAALTRKALETLIDQHPKAAAKLMMGVAQRLAERLRALSQQVQIYAGIRG